MFKITSVASALAVVASANPFVGEHMDKMHVEHGNGAWSTKLKTGRAKMN